MQPNDARMLLHCAVPTALAGVVGAAVSGLLAGGKGATGAVAGAVVVILFMGGGLAGLQKTAKSYPHLFQAMGLLLYTTQILLLAVVLAVFKGTTLFDSTAFAFTILGSTLVWITAQAVAHNKAKILYVEPDSSAKGAHAEAAGSGASS
jgi:ATP synthase protein I